MSATQGWVYKADAWLRLKERVVSVLQEHLQSELDEWATRMGVTLDLTAPAPQHYFLTDFIHTQFIQQAPVSLLVYDDDRSAQVLSPRSGQPDYDEETLEIQWVVEAIISPIDAYTNRDRTGRDQVLYEVATFHAEAFRGAIIHALAKYLPGVWGIEVVELRPSEGIQTRPDDRDQLFTMVRSTFAAQLDVRRPAPTYLP